MSGDSNIGAWIQFAKLTTAAGEMAPFPYIKGLAGCIATILEVIELAGKNNEDLQDLAESIGTTIRIIKETVEAHGDTSATRFRDVCVELQAYLESLITELNTTRRNLKSKSIMRFLKTKKVSGVIDGYKQRVNNIKADFLVLVTTDARLAISEMQDALSTVTQATETAQSHITSAVESQAHCIRSEIRSLGNIQREHVAQICEKLQEPKGYYKGQVRELFPGDIYIGNLVSPSRHRFGPGYEDRYGTVECSSTAKIIRIYQYSRGNKEAILKQFNDDADTLIQAKHPNLAQVFGICRSPNFPAIAFHGSTQVPFYDYEHNLTAKQIIPFYVQLYHDLESVAEHLSRHYTLSNQGNWVDKGQIHLNEHRQIIVTAIISNILFVGNLMICISDSLGNCTRLYDPPTEDNLYNAYDDIKRIIWSKRFRPFWPPNQPYAPGCVLTSSGETLVGKVQTRLDEWDVLWEGHTILLSPSTNIGSIMAPLPYAGTRPYYADISLHSFDVILNSWIAQASQLQSFFRSRGRVDDDGLFLVVDTSFTLLVHQEEKYDPFRLCNTFMAEDHHTLWLSISAPTVDYQTYKLSWQAVFTWFYDRDSEMSSVEVEEVFGVKLSIRVTSLKPTVSKTMLTTIPELNADYGFDPARGGADVCEYFGWPLMEILDVSTGDWVPLHGTVPESTSVISDDGYRTLSEKIASSLDNTLEGGHIDEASTETEIAVQTRGSKSSRGSRVFIAMSFVISMILLSFVVQTFRPTCRCRF